MELPPLVPGRLVARRKRFLADVILDDGREVTAHCPNPGRMTSCIGEGWPVWLAPAPSPKRRLGFTWEITRDPDGTYILVNTQRSNPVVGEWLRERPPSWLGEAPGLRPEVRMDAGWRVDFAGPELLIEVKQVSLRVGPGEGAFPDAVTARGQEHLRRLAAAARTGRRAILLFSVGRGDIERVRAAHEVDPVYARELGRAANAGVEVRAVRLEVDPQRLVVSQELDIVL